MTDHVLPSPWIARDRNNNPVPGALARFFRSGTTTPATVYADAAETIPHPVPLVADARGVFPLVFRSGQALRATVTDPAGAALPGFPMDPIPVASSGGGEAVGVAFSPTPGVPATNVQAAIENVQSQITAGSTGFGIGVTGNAPLIADLDATDTASGVYRFDGATPGTRPTGYSGVTGIVEYWRETAVRARQHIWAAGSNIGWMRRMEASVWGAWERLSTDQLSQVQAEDPASTVFGTVSGQRIGQAIVADRTARRFVSAEQVIAQSVTVSHGLGAVPFGFSARLRCVSANLGYDPGDEIDFTSQEDPGGSSGHITYANATEIGFRTVVITFLRVPQKGSPASGSIAVTAANWRLVFYAWL
jgi:hypothetical protein